MNKMLKKLSKGLKKIALIIGFFILITIIATTLVVQLSGDSDFQPNLQNAITVNDITELNPIRVSRIIKPKQSSEIIDAINNSTGPISIGGGRYSMGGQIAYEDSLHIDMRQFNNVLELDTESKNITVQAGITWRDIQETIDPHNLSVRIMQTYANFTVGGSLSVNVHGRYIGEGPLIKSVESLKVVLANGIEVFTSREQNPDIFNGVIGGMGGLGVITEATLNLTDNVKIERKTTRISTEDYAHHFTKNIRDNSDIVFHNGDLYPPDYDEILDVSWYKTDKEVTIEDRLIARDDEYKWLPFTADFVANYDIGKILRKNIIDPIYYSFDRIVWRNWEASYDVRELEPEDRDDKTYVLREYFVPVDNFDSFVPVMKDIFNRNDTNIINVSIRHAHAAPDNLLSWARNEVFAFVVYYRQGTDKTSKENVKKWSIEMIDAVIAAGGTYYLPYQIFASDEQFLDAYPNAKEFFQLKRRLDPDNRFTNQLWKQHYPSNEKELHDQKAKITNYYRGEEQTVLTIPEWYLVFNPLEYAEFLEGGHNPSDFPFMKSLDEYWSLYDRVVTLSKAYNNQNDDYMLMLRVIGISTTVEYMLKSLYENTIGRITRWTASGVDTEEDRIIAQAQRAYSSLIFDEAWYKFDFETWSDRIWADTDFFGNNFIRKLERKIFFTCEFGFKAFYAKLIAYGSQQTFEHDDGLIYLVTTLPETIKDQLPASVKIVKEIADNYLISIPRWGTFTKTVPALVAKGAIISDISGNRNIAVSFIAPSEMVLENGYWQTLFESRVVSDSSRKRHVVLVGVSYLGGLLADLNVRGFQLEHIYDY